MEKLVRLEKFLGERNPASKDPKAKSVQVQSIKKMDWLKKEKKPVPPGFR